MAAYPKDASALEHLLFLTRIATETQAEVLPATLISHTPLD